MSISLREVNIQKANDGIGLVLSSQKPCKISVVEPHSPAYVAGLVVGDEIIEINNKNVSQFNHSEVVRLISNKKAQGLKLKVQNKAGPINGNNNTSGSIFSNLNKLYNDFCSSVIFSSPIGNRKISQEESIVKENIDGTLDTTLPKTRKPKFNIEKLSNRRNVKLENENSYTKTRPKSLILPRYDAGKYNSKPLPKLSYIFDLNTSKNDQNGNSFYVGTQPNKIENDFNAIVLFICSIEIPIAANMFTSCSDSMEKKVADLVSKETEKPSKVLLRMKGDGIQVLMHHNKKLVYYPASSIFYSCFSSQYSNYFSFATNQEHHSSLSLNSYDSDNDTTNKFSCFIFKIDLDLVDHSLHDKDLSPFGLTCSEKKDCDYCCPEFPCMSSHVVDKIKSFYISQSSQFAKCRSNSLGEYCYDGFRYSPDRKLIATNTLTKIHENSRTLPTSQSFDEERQRIKFFHDIDIDGDSTLKRGDESDCLVMTENDSLSDTLKRKFGKFGKSSGNNVCAKNVEFNQDVTQKNFPSTLKAEDQTEKKMKKSIEYNPNRLFSVEQINTPPPSFLSGFRRGRRRSEGTTLSPSLSLKDFFRSTFISRLDTPEVIVKRDARKDSNANVKELSNGSSHDSLISIGRVEGWSRAFENLLADPIGIRCFQEFLRKEFSEENLLFWTACEKFKKLKDKEKMRLLAGEIFRNYLSPKGAFLVNVDQQAVKFVQENIETPNQQIFIAAQEQVFQLMKFDSYNRFLKSDFYQECLQADIEKKILPFEDEIDDPDFKKKSVALTKKAKSSLIDNQERKKNLLNFLSKNNMRITEDDNAKLRKVERSSSLSAVEEFCRLNSAMSPVCNGVTNKDDQLWDGSQVKSHCAFVRVRFPDGTSTIILAESGVTIRQSLQDVCQHKNIDFKSIEITVGESRQVVNPDGDISTYQDNVIYLEKRVLLRFDLPSGRSVGIKANPKKSVRDVLHPIMKKNGYDIVDYAVFVVNSTNQIPLDTNITDVEGQRLVTRLSSKKLARQNSDITSGKPPIQDFRSSLRRLRSSSFKDEKARSEKISTLERHHEKRQSDEHKGEETFHRKFSSEVKHLLLGRTKSADDDGANALLNVLRKSQSGRLDDQRGMITRDIEMPDFLKVSVNTPSTTRSIFKTSSAKSTPTKTSFSTSAILEHKNKKEKTSNESLTQDSEHILRSDNDLQSSETTLRETDDDIYNDSSISASRSKTSTAGTNRNHPSVHEELFRTHSYSGNTETRESLKRTMSANCRPRPLNTLDESFIIRELDKSEESSLLSPDISNTSYSSYDFHSSLERRPNPGLVKSLSYHGSTPKKSFDAVAKQKALSLNISPSHNSSTTPLLPIDIISYDNSPGATSPSNHPPVYPQYEANKEKLPSHLFQTTNIPTPEKEKLLGGETIRGRQNEKISFV